MPNLEHDSKVRRHILAQVVICVSHIDITMSSNLKF